MSIVELPNFSALSMNHFRSERFKKQIGLNFETKRGNRMKYQPITDIIYGRLKQFPNKPIPPFSIVANTAIGADRISPKDVPQH